MATKKEAELRRMANQYGLALRKSRSRILSINNQREYMLIDIDRNCVYAGSNYELTLKDIENILNPKTKKNEKSNSKITSKKR